MSTIVDTLYMEPRQLAILVEKYRECYLDRQDASVVPGKYFVIIPDESEERYFDFLVDNALAMSSVNFMRKLRGNDEVARRVMSRMETHSAGNHPPAGWGPQCGES